MTLRDFLPIGGWGRRRLGKGFDRLLAVFGLLTAAAMIGGLVWSWLHG